MMKRVVEDGDNHTVDLRPSRIPPQADASEKEELVAAAVVLVTVSVTTDVMTLVIMLVVTAARCGKSSLKEEVVALGWP